MTRESEDNEDRLEVDHVQESGTEDNLPLHYYGKGRCFKWNSFDPIKVRKTFKS